MKNPRLLALKNLSKKRNKFRNVGLTGGAFDILHEGHITFLENAKSHCQYLIVHITGNKRVKEKKGFNRPILDEKTRARIISSLRFVDSVFIYNGRHYDQKIISELRPDILFFNQDGYSDEVKSEIGKLKNFRGKIMVLPLKKENSSSRILNRIMKSGE